MEEVKAVDQKKRSDEYTVETLKESINTIKNDTGAVLLLYFLLNDGKGKTYLKQVRFQDIEQDDSPKDNKQSGSESQDAADPQIQGTDGSEIKNKKSEDGTTDSANNDDNKRLTLKEKKRRTLKEMYMEYLDELLADNSHAALCSLSNCQDDPNNFYLCDDVQLPWELSPYLDLDIARIRSSSSDQTIIPFFNALTDKLERLVGYIAYIGGTKHEGLMLFTKHHPVTRIKRNAFMLGIIGDSRFKRVDDMDILRFTGKAHLLRIDGHTIALDLNVLERDLGYEDRIKAKAQKAVEHMINKNWDFIADYSELDKIVNDYRLARKLATAFVQSPVINPPEKVNWPTAVEYMKGIPELKDILIMNGGENGDETKVDLSTPKARKLFVSLLDDDYLESHLSNSRYVASHKKTVDAQKSTESKKKSS